MGRFKTGPFEIVDEPVCRLQPPAAERKSVDEAPVVWCVMMHSSSIRPPRPS